MSFVVDSSVTLAWIYVDELTPATLQLSQMVTESGAWVPVIWYLEIANSLQTSIRHRRIDVAFRDQAIANLSELSIMIDTETSSFAWTTTLDLSDRFSLTMYDACYLELAQRKHLPLASLDKDLRRAARALDIQVLGT
jgi:predicted nucleic acid-binding protein